MAGPDYDVEIKQLQATMRTIEQVLDLEAMKSEIADLGEQVAAPDLWDDQANATRVTGRLSDLQGQVERFEALQGRIEDLGVLVELGVEEGDEDSLALALHGSPRLAGFGVVLQTDNFLVLSKGAGDGTTLSRQ